MHLMKRYKFIREKKIMKKKKKRINYEEMKIFSFANSKLGKKCIKNRIRVLNRSLNYVNRLLLDSIFMGSLKSKSWIVNTIKLKVSILCSVHYNYESIKENAREIQGRIIRFITKTFKCFKNDKFIDFCWKTFC